MAICVLMGNQRCFYIKSKAAPLRAPAALSSYTYESGDESWDRRITGGHVDRIAQSSYYLNTPAVHRRASVFPPLTRFISLTDKTGTQDRGSKISAMQPMWLSAHQSQAIIVHPRFPLVRGRPTEFNDLPQFCVIQIAMQLTSRELLRFETCSKGCKEALVDDTLWKNLCLSEFCASPHTNPSSWRGLYM